MIAAPEMPSNTFMAYWHSLVVVMADAAQVPVLYVSYMLLVVIVVVVDVVDVVDVVVAGTVVVVAAIIAGLGRASSAGDMDATLSADQPLPLQTHPTDLQSIVPPSPTWPISLVGGALKK